MEITIERLDGARRATERAVEADVIDDMPDPVEARRTPVTRVGRA
jgi:hypothetical protein